MDRHLREQAVNAIEENVEENMRRGEWRVYERYEIATDKAGNRYVVAPEANRVTKVLRPLSRESATHFLRFAGWVEEFGMDKELGTSRNEQAFEAWVREFGVLGLDPPDTSQLGMVNSQRVTADYLGMPWRGDMVIGRRNTAHGGPNETVENFAWEAWEAHVVLRLYESARSRKAEAVPSIASFMSTFDQAEDFLGQPSWVEREVYSQAPELAQQWALSVVESAVNRKIENHCYPTIQGAPGSYEQGWGFRTLLGAMWLQMMFLMRADRRCWNCDKPIDPGRRSHARFCDNEGSCRSEWNYKKGKGKSSAESREQKRRVRYAR